MIRHTPFHSRTAALNKTGLWSHWAGHLSAEKYQASEKFEYFAIRNSAGVFDTSPLYKYRIVGKEAEQFLAGVLARDIRKIKPGQAQYTIWCNDQGFVLEDGVVFRMSRDDYILTTAHPNLSYFRSLAQSFEVNIEDVSLEMAALAVQGPGSLAILESLDPSVAQIDYFGVADVKLGRLPTIISRTGYTGDLGYEIWVESAKALELWDLIFEHGKPHGAVAVGQIALLMARIEAGLLLIDADFTSARYAWNDNQRSTPGELGFGWMFRNTNWEDRDFIGKSAIKHEFENGPVRWKTMGVVVDWADWDRTHNARGVVPPKDHQPSVGSLMLYGEDENRIGYVTSFMYSPVLQRHIGIGRVLPEHARPETPVLLETTIDHQYDLVKAEVARLPFFSPHRKTMRGVRVS